MSITSVEVIDAGFGLKEIFKYILYAIMIVALCVSTFVNAIQQKDAGLILYDIGNTFLLSTKTIYDNSQKILNNGFIDKGETKFKTFLNTLYLYVKILAGIFVIFFWIKIIIWIIRHSPLSPHDSYFANITLALILFYVFQVVVLITNAAMTDTLSGLTGENSFSYFITMPFLSAYYLIKVLINIIMLILSKFMVLKGVNDVKIK